MLEKESQIERNHIGMAHKLSQADIHKIEQYRQTRKTSVLTILFTDIVGYTRFTFDAGELVSAKFRHIHDDLIIKQVKKDGHGEIIKQIGDSFLIVFSDPTIAVKQALKLQDLFRVNSDNLTYNDYILKIRIGLHMGQVSVEDHIVPDVFGTHVNLSSRVLNLAKGGQVLVSGSVWENASGWLKDEQDKKVESVYYGKIKLKGIGKQTDIYEFFTDSVGAIGIPRILLKEKQKYWLKLLGLIAVLFIATLLPMYLIQNKNTKDGNELILMNRGKIILADIDSYDEDIFFSLSFGEWKKDKVKLIENGIYPIESIKQETINRTNEKYQELLKTNFIADFDIETENEIKREYAKNGYTVPLNFMDDTIIKRHNYSIQDKSKIYNSVNIIIPHLYKFKDEDKYYLFTNYYLKDYQLIDNTGKYGNVLQTNTTDTKVISDIDSIPYLINIEINELLNAHKKKQYSKGKIIKVNGSDVLIKFNIDTQTRIPVEGVVLSAVRPYMGGYLNISDLGVVRRLQDLEKVNKYFGSNSEWTKQIDTNNIYLWSWCEYRDLKDSIVRHKAPSGMILGLGIDLKLVEVYDSTALAKVQFRESPWIELEIGDEVQLK